MQKMIWTPRESDLLPLVHSTMHLPGYKKEADNPFLTQPLLLNNTCLANRSGLG
jgi:hypothetical protein